MASSGHYADDGATRVQIVDGVGGSGSAVVPGTGATNLGKAEDDVANSGDVGVGALGVVNTTGASKAGNGDYTFIALSADGGVFPGANTVTRVTGDTQVKNGAGVIHTISIAPTTATPTAGLLTVYDSLTEANTILYSEWIFATTPGHTIILNCRAGTGIYVGYDGTLANVSCTVTYR